MFANEIAAAIGSAAEVTADIIYTTTVATAAAHKHTCVKKTTHARVRVFGQVTENPYLAAVVASSGASDFAVSDSPYKHSDSCYSIVEHAKSGEQYLYCIFDSARSMFTIDGIPATRDQVAELLTPSAARKLLDTSGTVHNVTNDIDHNVQVRTIKLDNVQGFAVVQATEAA